MNRPPGSRLSSLLVILACMIALAFTFTLTACSDVQMSATYSTLLDQQQAATQEAATRAAAGQLSTADAATFLQADANLLQQLRNARDGVSTSTTTATPAPAATVTPVTPATAPAVQTTP